MTVIEQKALALVNEVSNIGCYALCDAHPINLIEALCRAIEQHEAAEQELADVKQELSDYKQKVSDTLREYIECFSTPAWHRLYEFILPEPNPDPLVAALEGVTFDHYPPNDAKTIRAALDALGFEIREKNGG